MVAFLAVVTMFLGANLLDHTDDGCPIETHCTACVSHLAGPSMQVSVPSLAPVWSTHLAPSDPSLSIGNAGAPSTLALCGPPAA